jgi:hypothetical protein
VQIEGFIWREDIIDKLYWKHSVTLDEVEEVFEGKPKFLRIEKGKVDGENLYNALGQTAQDDTSQCFLSTSKVAKL